jgi:hypothetical protein
VLGVLSDGNWIRGVTVLSHIVMWVTWQWNTWRNCHISNIGMCGVHNAT